MRDSVDGCDNHRSAVNDYNETMQEPKSFFSFPAYQKPPPSTAGTTINSSFSASSLGPDPYAYTPPNSVTGEGVNKTFVNPMATETKQNSTSLKNEDETSHSNHEQGMRQSSGSRIEIDPNKNAGSQSKPTGNDGPNTLQAQEQSSDENHSSAREKTPLTSPSKTSTIQSSEVRNPYEAQTTLDKPNLHTEERQQQTLKPLDEKSAEQFSSQLSGDKGSPSTPSEHVSPNSVSNS